MDYAGLFKEFNIPTEYKSKGWINVICPYCGTTSFHLGFNIAHDYSNCFKCGGHNLRMALKKVLNIPETTLSEILEPFQTKNKILKKLNNKENLNKKKIELPEYPLSKTEQDYLLKRHFNPKELIRSFNIQGGGWVGEWKNRIIIPIYISGKLITYVGRTIIPDREPRYKFLSNEESVINPKKIFFNLDNCSNSYAVLLEGLFDVMRFGNDSICGFGITLTREQVWYLSERFKKIYIIFDNERGAVKKAREYAVLLSGHGLEVFIVDIADYGVKDIGEMSPYKIKLLKKEMFN